MPSSGFLCSGRLQIENSRKRKDKKKKKKYLDLTRELKTVGHTGDGNTNFSRCTWNGSRRTWKKTGGFVQKNELHRIIWNFEILHPTQKFRMRVN